jgi:indolepyruvate ferredoxin oxidoreductase
LSRGWASIIDGIGGTGVVTIGAILGMAAHLEGKGCGMIDMAGLAQKGGAVFSHVRIAKTPADIHAIRISAGKADLVLGAIWWFPAHARCSRPCAKGKRRFWSTPAR